MTHVNDFLSTRFGLDELEICWDIVFRHFVNCEIPVFRLAGTVLDMLVRVCCAPTVCNPNIVAVID